MAGAPRLVVIVGPTGAGKTRLAIALAERTGGEVISADSQQVYIGMDIGTGKVTAEERACVPHHVLDIVRPDEEMTAARFIELADQAIADMAARGRTVIVCGGTGLYVRALLLGLFAGPPASPEIRAELTELARAQGTAALHAELARVDPAAAAKIDPNDEKRTIRALEVFRLTGEPMSIHQAKHDHRSLPLRYPVRIVGVAPQREALYRAIDSRVDAMIEAGLELEVAGLRAQGYLPPLRSQQAIGYAELHDAAAGTVERARAIELIKRNSRHYARRQVSWYRGQIAQPESIRWYPDPGAVDLVDLERYLAGL
ncbi:MAG: tRNA (adenosine(37)-N6)-dimethylallyltransferase MiaA [Deltaproteobacteria bacterium]|nr:tRNA (adenosine(37)-N6)-dimethylallyltransferase MiaA [Deltaproteobacteria bacterium]MDQ3300633.1 tRNA (adenosine(37)-N6)-dimethylallyltransferase MiaA [Myxococcota bacterium]